MKALMVLSKSEMNVPWLPCEGQGLEAGMQSMGSMSGRHGSTNMRISLTVHAHSSWRCLQQLRTTMVFTPCLGDN